MAFIARRGVSTLILVHRRQLMDQWREQLATFLELPINQYWASTEEVKSKRTGIDRCRRDPKFTAQRLRFKILWPNTAMSLLTECHHLSAFTFKHVLREVKAKYVLGLTATPTRKDGHHPIIYMQCGAYSLASAAARKRLSLRRSNTKSYRDSPTLGGIVQRAKLQSRTFTARWSRTIRETI